MTHQPKDSGRDANRANEDKTYRVGYGRPPVETRFKPGASGNPKGRRKRTPSLSEVGEQVLDEKVEIRIGNRVLSMSIKYALWRAASRQALAGKPKLLSILPALTRYKSEILQGKGNATQNLSAEDEAILDHYFARRKQHKANDNDDD